MFVLYVYYMGQLLESISKKDGDEDFYLEQGRIYRAEVNIFEDYTEAERSRLFGRTPATAWENINAFDRYPEKTAVLVEGGAFTALDIESFKTAAMGSWVMELHDRIVPELRESVRRCRKLHEEGICSDLDELRYEKIRQMANEIARDTVSKTSLLTQLSRALENKDYRKASELQLITADRVQELEKAYAEYSRNIL